MCHQCPKGPPALLDNNKLLSRTQLNPEVTMCHFQTCFFLTFEHMSQTSQYVKLKRIILASCFRYVLDLRGQLRNFGDSKELYLLTYLDKVEKILKGSLDPITFTFSENSNYWQESLLELTRQNIALQIKNLFVFKSLLIDNAQQYFAFTSQANFPTHNLNFH